MLTLQQLLESDSIATLVAKLNNNFQTISASNGGPQGIRGSQGIPGLPGKKGPVGPTGAQGPTGTIAGIIPFALPNDPGTAGVGPTAGAVVPTTSQLISPWPYSSWSWLQYYHTPGGPGFTGGNPNHGDLYIDHANEGYWKWLDHFDTPGAYDGSGGFTAGGYYYFDSTTGGVVYPDLGATGGWGGTGWYFYPMPEPAVSLSTVWESDFTTYFTGYTAGPYPYGPQTDNGASQLKIPNARLITKYGTVWITTGSDSTTSAIDTDENFATESIGKWGFDPSPLSTPPAPRPGRFNAGVDRLLFKMSIDNLPYLSNITARGWTASTSGGAFLESSTFPRTLGGAQMVAEDYWTKPQYNVTMDRFTPLLFLSERTDAGTADIDYFSSIGLYMHTADENLPAAGEGLHKSLFLWSSRAAKNPLEMFTGGTPVDSTSTANYGEFVLDFRRLIASNQYVCSVPTDMRLSSEAVNSGAYTSGDPNTIGNRVYGGFISAINGKAMTGDKYAADYWEYGLGNFTPADYAAIGGTHDPSSGTAGMYTRTNWYGSAVLATKPSDWETEAPGENEYVRVAGMLERGRRYQRSVGTYNNYFSELIFYTSQFRVNNITPLFDPAYGVDNDIVDPTDNSHKSMPSLYVSPFRNIGIGTFVGGSTAINDLGPVEPKGHLHVHTKYTTTDDDPTGVYKSIIGSSTFSAPLHTFISGVFTGEKVGGTASSALILLGNLTSPAAESVNPGSNTVNRFTGNLNSAIRADQWATQDSSSLRFGTKGSTVSVDINTLTANVVKNEFQLHLHPLNKFATAGNTETIAPVGIGVHNHFPQTRFHAYGKNAFNESEVGQQNRTPGGAATGPSGSFPYYSNSLPTPSNNQMILDFLGSSYVYPVGLKDYQYGVVGGATASTSSQTLPSFNSAVYPTRESKSPTRHYIPWTAGEVNFSYPSATGRFNGAYKHGGTGNALFPLTSYLGFNLFRDISSADGHAGGDDRDQTRWVIGTTGPNGLGGANNGAAAIVFSPDGELGIVTIPKGRDGGRAYQQWEQRGMGTRDVLNNMKVLFDARGNMGIGNAPGVDLDAYPSLERDRTTGKLNYVPATNVTTSGPTAADGGGSLYNIAYWGASGQYGRVVYGTAGNEYTATSSPASRVNKRATQQEYIRFEVAAEKGWQGDGRMSERGGWGYPQDRIDIDVVNIGNYIKTTSNVTAISSWTLFTDIEGRIINSVIIYTSTTTASSTDFISIIYPHPTEFSAGGAQNAYEPTFVAPVGAQAAEWSKMSQEYLDGTYTGILGISSGGSGANRTFEPQVTVVARGGANVRLNNYVAGEGSDAYPGEDKAARQASPKLILTFLEKDPASRPITGTTPYKKVNTVLLSAQNEATLREYYVPKADNTGGTLMVFTDHLGSKEYVSGFDRQLTSGTGYSGGRSGTTGPTVGGTGATGNIQKLLLTQVVTCEILQGYTGGFTATLKIDSSADNINGIATNSVFSGGGQGVTGVAMNTKSIGYVNYFNRLPRPLSNGTATYFNTAAGEHGERVLVARDPSTIGAIGILGPGWSPSYDAGTGGTIQNTGPYVHATVRRNIDFYYNVFQGTKASYGGEMGAPEWDSKATEIRFKRINSEFALVDFNITVEVKNPILPGGTPSADNRRASSFIDFGVPRMTQSLSFIYSPDRSEINDKTEDTWGNGPWFHMWSGYRNWLPGFAVVGDDKIPQGANQQTSLTPGWDGYVDSPYFNDNTTPSPSTRTEPMRTWTGNKLASAYWKFDEAGSTYLMANAQYTLSRGSIFYDTSVGEANQGYGIRDYFITSPINRSISASLLDANTDGSGNFSYKTIKNYSFMYHLPGYVSQWGGQTMSRVRNCSWRMIPTRYVETTDGGSYDGETNNTFKLEVMFDVPIMHCDHEFRSQSFYGDSDTTANGESVIQPYKYLTISGQGIIRYGKTTKNSFSPLEVTFT